jgi:ABC-type branched-subunit amino acid transport system ATPase component
MSALLEVRDLRVRFGGLSAVDGVDLDVEAGTFVGVIGPNGAGKTTFIDAVTGLVPSTGSVAFDDREVGDLAPHERVRAGVGRTFQSLELFEDLTVRENLLSAAEPARWWSPLRDLFRPRADRGAAERVDAALELAGLTDQAEALPPDLSLGQRKLVTVARALAGGPRQLLLDEPAAGLDSDESLELGRDLRRLVDGGVTIVLVDHDMGLVLGVCDVVHVLEFGSLIASGTPDEIKTNDRVIHAYLGTGAAPAEVGPHDDSAPVGDAAIAATIEADLAPAGPATPDAGGTAGSAGDADGRTVTS